MHKLTFLAGFGAGYVLGAKAGRDRYEALRRSYEAVKDNDKVQSATEKAKEKLGEAAVSAKDMAVEKLHEARDSKGEKEEWEKAEGRQSPASGAPSSGADPDGLDSLAGPKGQLP